MSRLGHWGRFANQVFQYAFLRIYTQKNNFRLETAPWIGQYLFGHSDPPVSRSLPSIDDSVSAQDPYNGSGSCIAGASDPPKNVDLLGYFQFHTSYYAPYKDFYRSLFKPVPAVEGIVRKSVEAMRSRGNTIIGFHLRRGDYETFKKSKSFFVTPCSWYLDWLRENWERFDNPVLFIASDELHKVIDDFKEYNPVTNKSLEISIPRAPYYPDFYTLSNCDVMCISNSSFSFAASMLNESCKEFYRPRLSLKKFILYDPWDSHPVFRDESYLYGRVS